VPIVDKSKIIGVVAAKQIIKLIASKDNKWIKADRIYTQNPITVSADESLSHARRIMTTKRIDHLPVVNQGKVTQVITSFHVLESIIPSEKQGRNAMITKTEHALESKIGNIGSTRIPQCLPSDDLNKIINLMIKIDTTCCLVSLWDNLQGIITYRDILDLLASKLETKIPLYIVGMPVDEQNVNLISTKFEKILKRLQQVYSQIQEARVSINHKRTGNKKVGKYEVSIMIIPPHHTPLVYSSVGFDLSQVLEELGEKLLRTLSKRAKLRSKDSIRKINMPIF
jgi:CBS domain-containing protein